MTPPAKKAKQAKSKTGLSDVVCRRRGCRNRIPQFAVDTDPDDGFCSLACFQAIHGNPWQRDDNLEEEAA